MSRRRRLRGQLSDLAEATARWYNLELRRSLFQDADIVTTAFRIACFVLLVSWLSPSPAASQSIFGPPPGKWKFEVRRDQITDLPFYLAQVSTRRAVIARERGDHLVGVGIWCFKGKGTLGVRWSGSAAGSKNLVLEFRFDGEPGYRTQARYVNRTEQQTTSIEDIRHFLDGAARSEGLYVRVTSDLYDFSEAYFVVRGGRDMVDKFRSVCPEMVTEQSAISSPPRPV